MIISILKEPKFENRVSFLPDQAEVLVKKGVKLICETDAGNAAFANDNIYQAKGIEIVTREQAIEQADVICCIHPLENSELQLFKSGTIVLGVYQPLSNKNFIKTCASKNITVFSMDMIPRTTRAQSMDVLSSQANIAGYRAVLLAATLYPRYFPMFMTAAGSIAPAKTLILGAGVAGLQAVATARRLGAIVEVFDTRPAVKEEVMSLGAKFVEVPGAADASKAGGYAVEQSEEYKKMQQQKIAEAAIKADIIISTAQIPGKKAPVLITQEILANLKGGTIIIDLAASTGGNTAITQNNQTITSNGITVVGDSNLQSGMPTDASKLYGKNIYNFLQLMIDKEAKLNLDFSDDLIKGTCIVHQQKIVNDRVAASINE